MGLFDFGKRREDPPRPSHLDTIDLKSTDDIAWVKQSGDPLIWHSVAQSTILYADDKHDFLRWVVEQENLDRVTAAMMFMTSSNGKNHLLGRVLAPEEIGGWMGEKQAKINHMIERLCELDKSHIFEEHGIGLPGGFGGEMHETLAELSDHPLCPKRLLSQPIPDDGVKLPYVDIGEGDLCSRAYLKREMPYMFDKPKAALG